MMLKLGKATRTKSRRKHPLNLEEAPPKLGSSPPYTRKVSSKSSKTKERPRGIHGDLPKLLEQAFDEDDRPNEIGELALKVNASGRSGTGPYYREAGCSYMRAVQAGFKGHFRQWFDVVMWADWK